MKKIIIEQIKLAEVAKALIVRLKSGEEYKAALLGEGLICEDALLADKIVIKVAALKGYLQGLTEFQ